MLLRRICQKAEQEDLLSQYKFFACLEKSCDNQTIKSVYFSDKLRKIVYGVVSNVAIRIILSNYTCVYPA
jgi:hypothetical protein